MSERSLNPAATAPPGTIRLIRQEQMPRRGTQPLAVRKDHADAETDRAFGSMCRRYRSETAAFAKTRTL